MSFISGVIGVIFALLWYSSGAVDGELLIIAFVCEGLCAAFNALGA